jgi:Uma2 family endonuclease
MATDIGPTRKFTAEEYERLVELGIFGDDERLELIDGDIIEMTPIGHRHAACANNLHESFVEGLGRRVFVWGNGPARLAIDSVPQPDLVLLRRRSYQTGTPTPEDVLLIVEVAESSLRYDRTVKLRLYARAGIEEYWIVDVVGQAVEVYRSPEGDGYRERRRIGRGESVTPAAVPDVAIAVDDIFS